MWFRLRPIILAAGLAAMLAGCLSMEVTVDVSERGEATLSYRYAMATEVWELGVFDSDSPERVIPVSRRDAEETANLHEGVELRSYDLDVGHERTVVEVTFSADSVDALAPVWAGNDVGEPAFRRTDRSLTVLVATGVSDLEDAQRDLVRRALAGQTLDLALVVPSRVVTIDEQTATGDSGVTEVSGARAVYSVSLGDLVTRGGPTAVTVSWE